jgi:restriction system protein
VNKDEAPQFFKVRFWGQDDIIDEIFAHYDKLDEDIRAELPLKRFWTLAVQGEE